MKPFVQKVEAAQGEGKFEHLADDSPLGFLKTWKNPIAEDDVSQLTEPGRDDAFAMGKKSRELYSHLFPPRKEYLTKGKKKPVSWRSARAFACSLPILPERKERGVARRQQQRPSGRSAMRGADSPLRFAAHPFQDLHCFFRA